MNTNIIVQAAKTLSVRFNNKVGCLRSWNDPKWSYPVIIDNMMNLHHGFILLHGTGHKPANSEVDVPIIYADYYFIEALQRSKT